MANILVADDEILINELIVKNLETVGHKCVSVYDGLSAIRTAETKEFDLILLDILMPAVDGFSAFEKMKDTPVIFLTAKDSLQDKIKGLHMGAEDYITKPFEMLELLARVEVVLRRSSKEENTFSLGDMRLDMDNRQIFYKNEFVPCTPQEFELMAALARNKNIALSREKLLELAWGYDYVGDTRTVDVHIQKLRKKLSLENNIQTVYKYGYRLEVPHEK